MKPLTMQGFAVFILCLSITSCLMAQNTMFQHFQSNNDLKIEVVCDWDSLSNIRDDTEVGAITRYNGQDWETEVRLRGRSRRMSCDTMMRPFRLQFRKKELRNAGYQEFRNHKIVTPCLNNKHGLENVQEELLLYQLYRIITDSSFMITEGHLIRSWPEERNPPDEIPILVIEPNSEMAARLGGVEIESVNFPEDSIDVRSYNITALYQFMIGNFDWNYRFNHNIKLIRSGEKAVVVPYDFDYAAICDVPYRRVPSDLNMQSKFDRVYLGEHFIDQLPEAIPYFIAVKPRIYEHVQSFEQLKNSQKKWILKYFDTFYEYIEDPESTFEYGMRLPYKGL